MTWSNSRFNVWRSFVTMATNLPSFFSIQFLEQFLKFLVNFTLLKYIKSQRNYGFLITKWLIFGFQILDLKDHFSASLKLTKIFNREFFQSLNFGLNTSQAVVSRSLKKISARTTTLSQIYSWKLVKISLYGNIWSELQKIWKHMEWTSENLEYSLIHLLLW